MKRAHVLTVVALALVGAAWPGPSGSTSDSEETERHWVSIVFGCVEVPQELHSFQVANLRDAFAGVVAAHPKEEPLLHWAAGLWDFASLLRSFEPQEPPPAEGSEDPRGRMWSARRDTTEFLILRSGQALLFGEVRDDQQRENLGFVLRSYRAGSANCSGAERPISVSESWEP